MMKWAKWSVKWGESSRGTGTGGTYGMRYSEFIALPTRQFDFCKVRAAWWILQLEGSKRTISCTNSLNRHLALGFPFSPHRINPRFCNLHVLKSKTNPTIHSYFFRPAQAKEIITGIHIEGLFLFKENLNNQQKGSKKSKQSKKQTNCKQLRSDIKTRKLSWGLGHLENPCSKITITITTPTPICVFNAQVPRNQMPDPTPLSFPHEPPGEGF